MFSVSQSPARSGSRKHGELQAWQERFDDNARDKGGAIGFQLRRLGFAGSDRLRFNGHGHGCGLADGATLIITAVLSSICRFPEKSLTAWRRASMICWGV